MGRQTKVQILAGAVEVLNRRTLVRRGGTVVSGILLMAFVPLWALDDPRPSKLGWHMYAAAVDLPRVEVLMTDGSRQERPIGSIASGFRPELSYFSAITRFICSRESEVVVVHLSRQHPAYEVETECSKF
ncbi:hypothetical protein ACLH0K_12360 [Arthrobacter sp. MPF02]|uniref:hypothetical protein n=1 Tax=Arthrobacter sp. MPF02 TaxID=3388492 RepID=UPI003984B3F8